MKDNNWSCNLPGYLPDRDAATLFCQSAMARVLAGVLVALLAGCDGSVKLTDGDEVDDEVSDIFILELDSEVGPIDDGLSPDEPVFHFEGDFTVDANGVTTSEPALGAALAPNPERKREGAWTSVFNWPVSPIHMALLPDSTVLTYGTNPDAQRATGFTLDKWFPSRGTGIDSHETSPTGIETNLFCSAQSILSDGNVLISGGDGNTINDETLKNDGVDATTIFDYQTNLIFDGPTMHFARWYPTLLTLADGRQLALGGRAFRNNSPLALNDDISIPPVPEVFDPETGLWSLLAGATDQALFNRSWYYPRAWLRHNGNVVMADIGQDRLYELSANGRGSLTELGQFTGSFGGVNSPAAMFKPGQILFVARNKRAEVLDITGNSVTVEQTSPSVHSRDWADATVLANGEVFLSGGISIGASQNSGDYPGEIWNPDTGQWTLTAKAAKARLYHSTAILLPNGRVLTAGGGPPGPVVNMNGEIFIPPYLFDENGALAVQPAITEMDDPDYDSEFFLRVGSDDQISKVSFVRAGSATHSFDQSQRYMELAYRQTGDTLNITAPANRNIAPPGLYMLFVFNEHGVPSQAKLAMLGGDGPVNPVVPVNPVQSQNLALTGTASQSSTGFGGVANLAIDGNTDGNFSAGSVTHTELNTDASWQVQLAQTSDINQIVIHNRTNNCCLNRLNNYTVAVLDDSGNTVFSQTYATAPTPRNSIDLDVTGRTVRVSLSGTLSLAEVEVFGTTNSNPVVPVNPVNPDPVDPVAPVDPVTPVAPVNPVDPDNIISNGNFSADLSAWASCGGTSAVSAGVVTLNDGGCLFQEFTVVPGAQYSVSCLASASEFTSLQLSTSDVNFAELTADLAIVTSTTMSPVTATVVAPDSSAQGVITLYSDDQGSFDNCVVTTDAPAPVPSQPEPIVPVSAADNLLSNGDFTNGDSDWFSCGGSHSISNAGANNSDALEIAGGGCLFQEFTATPGSSYEISCSASATAFSSVTLLFSDVGFTSLAEIEAQVPGTSLATVSVAETAPANTVRGVITLYSDDTAVFDNCAAVEL